MTKTQKIFALIIIILLTVIILQLWHIAHTVDYIDWDIRNILGKLALK